MSEIKTSRSELYNLLREVPKLNLDPNIHEVNFIPEDIKIHFVDSSYMDDFLPFQRLKSKTIKMVNLYKPAINLSFYEKHKYKLDKDVEPASIKELLSDRMDTLYEIIGQQSLFQDQNIESRREEAKKDLDQIKDLLENMDQFEFAVSNYYRNYTYMYVSYRYRLEDGSLDYASEHLLNSERDKYGHQMIRKENIIFIDAQMIGEHTPYQNKKIEEYLKTFPQKLDIGIKDIFIKQKSV